MRPLLIPLLLLLSPATAFVQERLTDDMLRQLGEDPVKRRAEEARIAQNIDVPRPAPMTAEEKALNEKAVQMASALKDSAPLAKLATGDPLLHEIYAYRVAQGPKPAIQPWMHAVDEDILRRPDAGQVMKAILLEDKLFHGPYAVFSWQATHPDTPWSRELMEAGIRDYHDHPEKWTPDERLYLAGTVAAYGDASHEAVLDEIQKAGVNTAVEKRHLKQRLEKAKNNLKARSAAATDNRGELTQSSSGAFLLIMVLLGLLVVSGLWLRTRRSSR